MKEILNLSRRVFLKTSALAGGGLILGFYLPEGTAFGQVPGPASGFFAPNAFIRIGRDGSATIVVNHSEMGQGVYTSLPMLVAEELEADWSLIRVEAAPVDPAYNHPAWGIQGTGGSTSVRSEWERLRKAGAAAREMLVTAAAAAWKVDPKTCRAENGQVIHSSGKKLSYGALAEKSAALPVPQEPRLKPPAQFKLIGKPMKRLDAPAKVQGTAVFGLDVRLPGMLTAVVSRPPVFGSAVKSYNADKTKAVKGVRMVVQVPSGIAVAGGDFWSALRGREALEIEWDEGPLALHDTAKQRAEYAELAGKPGVVAARKGDAAAAMAKAAKKIEADYELPYLAHAPMEPLNCTVDLRADGCEIWTGTQFQTVDRNTAAKIAGLPPEKVKLHTTLLGGGFGRRAVPDSHFVSEAIDIAKEVKVPVKVVWTREDDIKGGYYRPMWFSRIAAGLDARGSLVAWRHTLVGQSILEGTPFAAMMVKNGVDETSVEGAADIPYDIPNLLVDLHSTKIGIPVLWWRSVGHSHTAFVVETFIDQAARVAGQDPYEFRRRLLAKHPRHLGVMKLAAEKAGWGKPPAKGRSRGIAVHHSFGSYVAQVAEVSVGPNGRLSVHRVVCAIDCGRVVNPDTVSAQMESGIAFGLSAALHGQITFSKGRVNQGNFDDYEIVRMDEMPRVETHIVPSQAELGGVGEPGVPPVAPAVCNAIFAATGKRIHRLPIRSADLRKA